jgi:DNA-binding NarL/FixJ family response regulator
MFVDMEEQSDSRMLLVLHLERKRAFLAELADSLDAIAYAKSININELRKLPSLIRAQIRTFDHLSGIEQQVQQRSSEFVQALLQRHPDLSPTLQRISVYAAQGLSVTEMADVLIVQPRAIQKQLAKLRELCGVASHPSLLRYLRSIASPPKPEKGQEF